MQYLINNAGVAKWADLGNLQEEDMLHLFRTNTLGPLMITQEVLREGLLKSGSVVANMTSKVSHLQLLHSNVSQGRQKKLCLVTSPEDCVLCVLESEK